MKACTDIKQSKKLAEILPIKTADMCWSIDIPDLPILLAYPITDCDNWENKIPAWSLAALLGVLPTIIGNFFEKNALRIRMDKGENDFNIWYENFDCGDVAEGLDVKENNPVDACYEMIMRLNELKML